MGMNVFIIGCGGVGSFLTPSIIMLLGKRASVTLVDGDDLEKSNLNRQLFTNADIGRNKAEALSIRYHSEFVASYYSTGLLAHDPGDWLMACVDNHASRLSVLQSCDINGCKAILAANESFSAEAYYYQPDWRGSPLDPRIYYPEIATNNANDPRRSGMGCTGEAQEANRQLVSANFMAAALAQHLFVLWALSAPRFDRDILDRLPYRLRANQSRLENSLINEINSQTPTQTAPA